MSFCRVCNIHSLGSRPLSWTYIPREKYNGISRASGGRESSRPERGSEGDGSGMNPLWDSNEESVRRKNRNRSDGRGESSSQSASTPDWLTPKKEWTFNNSRENRKGEKKKARTEEELLWWKPKYDYDDRETEDEEEDDEDDEEYGNTKSGQVFSSLRWGIPLSLIIVLPWFLGNPVVLLLALAALPAAQRAVGPSVNELWRSFLGVAGSSSQKRRREAEAYDSSSDEREDAYSSWGGECDNGQPNRYKKPASNGNSPAEPFPYSDVDSNVNRPVSRQGSQQAGPGVSMGGWEDVETDRRGGRMPVRRSRRSSKLGWRSRKKEKPLFVRLLLALFPFLQNWGGWLFIFLFFPFLE